MLINFEIKFRLMKKTKIKQHKKKSIKDSKSKIGKIRGKEENINIVELQWRDEQKHSRYLNQK